jgi:hypothetical protein
MKIDLTLSNCFWLMLPLLAWNLVLGPRITQPAITSDARSPKWLLVAENLTRILVFALPLIIPLQARDIWGKSGLAVYSIGTLVYFTSWMPLLLAPDSAWSNSPAGLLAPRLTPLLSFLGIALIGQTWPYGLVAAVFIFFHIWHGIQNL